MTTKYCHKVRYNDDYDYWYVVYVKPSDGHETVLKPRYRTLEDAQDACISLIEDSR